MPMQERCANSATKPCFATDREVHQVHIVMRIEPVTYVATLGLQAFEILTGIYVVVVRKLLLERGYHKLFVVGSFLATKFRTANVSTVLVHFS
jgi:hypothetical protein